MPYRAAITTFLLWSAAFQDIEARSHFFEKLVSDFELRRCYSFEDADSKFLLFKLVA
ncbi:hypothetical protein XF_1805 [Xylella fastidiosa 9a5c]|uniref:Uncharacterized protein n=1 Tax=Xylella fastidiosa (strain 9a5c) TaxID=160492 RepID=Q9PCH4_XYLFA|nr:hypothetical protein XF_1805 [Xylella fastidiosa 9a5c]